MDGLTSETSQTWANPDGSLTADIASQPERVQQSDGSWTDIDTTLEAGTGVVRPHALAGDVTLSDGGADASFVGESTRDPKGRAVALGLGLGRSLPVPVLSGSTARYADVLPSTDLVVRVGRQTVSHDFIVKSRSGLQASYRLPLLLKGLTPKVLTGGSIELDDADGKRVYAAPAPIMWDASVDPSSGLSSRVGKVTATIDTSGSSPVLVLTPDPAFLADPTLQFPLTIDPSFVANPYTDTWVQNQTYTVSQAGSDELRAGSFDGATIARSFVKFTVTSLAGKHITGASLRLRNWYAQTCTGNNVNVARIIGSWDSSTLTWANQPTITSTGMGYSSAAYGFSSACPENSIYYTVTPIVQAWADGTANYGLKVYANTELATGGWRRYRSGNYPDSTGSVIPHLSVTYNSYPTAGSRTSSPAVPCVTGTSRPFVNTTTPWLDTVVNDVDGGNVREAVDVFTTAGTSLVTNGLSAAVSAGRWNYYQVPTGTLSDAGSYKWRVRGWDGTDYSTGYSSYCEFSVDTTAPSATTVTSTGFPQNTWTNGVSSGTFSFAATDTNFDHYLYDLDKASPTTRATGSSVTINPMPGGWHHLNVRAVDKAGNAGPVADYAFGSGSALVSPADGQVTQASVDLIGSTAPGASQASFYWRRASTDAWALVPTTRVTPAAASPAFSGWPYTFPALTGNGAATPALRWDVAGTDANLTGPVQVAVCFGDTTACPASPGTTLPTGGNATAAANVVLDRNAFNVAATSTLGPAGVNLLTGNTQLSTSDVSVPGAQGTSLSISRVLNTATVASTPGNAALGSGHYTTTGVFGPGWTASLPVDSAGSDWTGLVETGSVLTLNGPDQSTVAFAPGTGAQAGTWQPTGPDGDSLLSLTTSAAADCASGYRCFTLTDGDNTQVVFQSLGATSTAGTLAAPLGYTVTKVTEPGVPGRTTFASQNGLVTRVLSPVPTGATCDTSVDLDVLSTSSWTAGCTGLALTYGDGTTGPAGQLLSATYLTTTGTGAGSTLLQVDVGCWRYDSNNRLSDSWDPRDIPTASAGPHVITCGSTPLRATHYTYDGTGRITAVTPAWNGTSSPLAGTQLFYDANGRLSHVDRTHLDNSGTEVSSIAYGVPLAADSTHPEYRPDLTGTATWGQADSPDLAVGGTVTCPPGSPQATATGDLRPCSISYLDANGRTVNTASYSGTGAGGWHLSTTEYDTQGHVIRSLDAADREEALNPTGTDGAALTLPTDTAAAAVVLSTINQYQPNASDGVLDLVDTFGPYHRVALGDGSNAPARAHTHVAYDTGSETGHPAGGSLHLTVATVTGASQGPDATATNEVDQRTSTSSYATSTDSTGWTYRIPLITTTDPNGLNIRRQTVLDPATGRVVQSRMPNDVVSATPGATAGTTITVYYSTGTISGADSDCGNASPLWDGLLCKTYAANATPTAGQPGLITTKITGYDYLGRPTGKTETPAGDATHARTTGTLYGFNSTATSSGDSSNPYANSVWKTTTSGGLGTALPAQTTSYDTTTGLPTGLGDGSSSDASSYDDFGRLTSYTENTTPGTGQSNTATTVYDPSTGRVSSRRDEHQRSSFTYNSSTEFRGLPTSVQVDVTGSNNSSPALWTGTFTAAYDSDGALSSQTDPNGVTTSLDRDEAGQLLSRTDTKAGTAWLTDTVTKSIDGQNLTHQAIGSLQGFAYDAAGRLTLVQDIANNICTTRRYLLDANSNRLGMSSTAATDQTCLAGTAPTATQTYDSADRLLTSGTVYDSFGRTTTVPAANVTGGANLVAGYFANDLVASQSQGSTTQNWTLDQTQQRLRTATTTVSGTVSKATTNHYDDASSDSPDWIAETSTGSAWTANISDLLGSLAVTVDQNGTPTFQYADLHGDIQATCAANATAPTFTLYTDEFGSTASGSTVPRYGWLGGKQRSGEDLGGLVLMGVRLYDPTLGRFLSTDPVPGGSANAYDYTAQDPVNQFDLDGRRLDPGETTLGYHLWYRGCPGHTGGNFCARNRHSALWANRAKIATIAADGACFAVSAVACLAWQASAFAVRAHHRGRKHMRASFGDAIVTAGTFGTAGAADEMIKVLRLRGWRRFLARFGGNAPLIPTYGCMSRPDRCGD